MSIRQWLWVSLIIPALCAGCGSRVPYATTFPLQAQKKMQAAKHWEVFAEDITARVEEILEESADLRLKPIYLVPKEGTPFEEIFHELLVSELVSHGLIVSQKESGALKLDYDTEILVHSDRSYQKFPYKWTVLTAGVSVARNISDWAVDNMVMMGATLGTLADVASSHYAGPPGHKEVIITTSLGDGDYFFMHRSDIYYINDADWWHYVNALEPSESGGVPGEAEEDALLPNGQSGQNSTHGRTFSVVN